MLRWIFTISIALSLLCSCSKKSRLSGPLQNEAYVWQRVWNPQVSSSVREHGSQFNRLIVLAAEVAWVGRKPDVTLIPLDGKTMAQAGCSIGIALRIGPFSGPFEADDERGRFLVQLAKSLMAEAQKASFAVSEFQVDFDCAESKLDGYRVWVEAIRTAVQPAPLTITVLPSWLKRRAFRHLVEATDGFVLQVHSLERPKSPEAPFSLCDSEAAFQAIEMAGKLGIPFRVALPTYGYVLAFDSSGRFIGLSTGGKKERENGATSREVHAQPNDIAAIVNTLALDRPAAMRGIIWYRLPVSGEKLNWSWPTLAAVMAGKRPEPKLRESVRKSQPELFEIDLINEGDGDYEGAARFKVHWENARLIASDVWAGFESTDAGRNGLKFESRSVHVPAGERYSIGWLRLNRDSEVRIESVP